jgi:hypothetical protein
MHNAPPVVFPVGRFVWGPRLGLLLAAVVACVLAVWLVWAEVSASRLAWTVGLWMAAALCSLWWGRQEYLQEGELVWDGEAWHGPHLEGADEPIHLTLTFDGGHFMLVSWRSAAQAGRLVRTQHALIRRADMPSRWHGFRCAVYSRRTAPAGVT